MPPSAQPLFSPAELAYLHSSLSLTPPIRPDARLPTQFRPLVAETEILPGAYGSARICFADGTEAIVGVKAEVEKSSRSPQSRGATIHGRDGTEEGARGQDQEMGGAEQGGEVQAAAGRVRGAVELTIEIPGFRDDDALPVFLAAMLNEALSASGELGAKLYISPGWHWKLYVDILLLSAPHSYPIPLLSLTTHLALLNTRLPRLVSTRDEDPFFDDDWDAAEPLYPLTSVTRPPITLLVAAVGSNVLFDPSGAEMVVADAVLAVSIARGEGGDSAEAEGGLGSGELRLLALRTIDPPSRTMSAGMDVNAKGEPTGSDKTVDVAERQGQGQGQGQGLWRPPRGGMKRALVSKVVDLCVASGGVGEEVLAGLQGVEVV